MNIWEKEDADFFASVGNIVFINDEFIWEMWGSDFFASVGNCVFLPGVFCAQVVPRKVCVT